MIGLALLNTVINGTVSFFTKRQEIKAKKQERFDRVEESKVVANIRRIESGDSNATKLDELSIASRGWKDDYLLLITTAPIILSFHPDSAHYVKQGFDVLKNSVPEYYWYALAMIYIDTFGFRRMLRVAVERWLDKKYGA